MAKIVRLTENDLTRIVKRVIMESQSTHYHLYVEGLDEIEDTMKIKRLTDDDLDDIREQLEDEKKRIKGEKYLTEIEKKRLNKRVNSLIEKLRSKIQEQRIASFDDDMGWYDEDDMPVKPEDFGDDYDEEEFDEFEPMMAKHGKNQRWFDDSTQDRYHHSTGKKMFDKYREHTGKPFKVRTRKSMNETEKMPNERDYGAPFFDLSKVNDEEYEKTIFDRYKKWQESDDAKRHEGDYKKWLKRKKEPSFDPMKELGIEPYSQRRSDEDPSYMNKWDKDFMKAIKSKKKR